MAMTVGALVALLAQFPADTEVFVDGEVFGAVVTARPPDGVVLIPSSAEPNDRVVAIGAPTEGEKRCPVADCGAKPVPAGAVFCESGPYDAARDRYAAEGDADVYRCGRGHIFAFAVPIGSE